jgi:putative transposase
LCATTNIRRYFREGQFCFLTHVTYERRPILVDNIDILWQAYDPTCRPIGMDIVAWVVIPDHVHMIVTCNKGDVSAAMKRFKLKFSGLFRSRHHLTSGRIWQYRFWDHIIRDSPDLQRHIDYIHYNPVKHGLVTDPFEYEHS